MRVDPDLWAELERLAAAELRSVNGQIEYLLRQALNPSARKATVPQLSRPRAVKARR